MDLLSAVGNSGGNRVQQVAKTNAVPSPAKSGAKALKPATANTLSASQGAAVVDKAVKGAKDSFSDLRKLQADIADATKNGKTMDEATKKALNEKIAAVAKKIDAAAAAPKQAGDVNLLASQSGTVKIATKDGVELTVKAETQDSKRLGLTDSNGNVVQITDEQSLRKAAAAIGLATGQAQLTTFRLQAAQGVTGPSAAQSALGQGQAPAGANASAFDATANLAKALGNQAVARLTGKAAGTTAGAAANPNANALADLEKALASQRAFNKGQGYGSLGQAIGRSSSARGLLSLLA